MRLRLFGMVILMFSNLKSSDSSPVLTWIQKVLLSRKMDNLFAVSDPNRVAFMKASYANRNFEDICFVQNDSLDIVKPGFVRCYNPDFIETFEVKQDRERIIFRSNLALKHIWVSSGRLHCFYYLLRKSNFESCPISNLYEELLKTFEINRK